MTDVTRGSRGERRPSPPPKHRQSGTADRGFARPAAFVARILCERSGTVAQAAPPPRRRSRCGAVRVEHVPGVAPHPREPARAHRAQAHSGERVEHVVAHVEAEQGPVADLDQRDGLVLVGEEDQAVADAEERVAHEHRQAPVRRVHAVDAPEERPERAHDQVGGLLVQVGRQRLARAGDEVGWHGRRMPAHGSAVQAPGGGAAGSRMRNRVPTPTLLATSISPPIAVMRLWQIERPSPVPTPTGLVVKKGSKMRGRTSSGIPMPVSEISTATRPWPSTQVARRTSLRSGAFPLNAWAAFTRRFRKTCTRRPSLQRTSGTSPYSLTTWALWRSS